MKKIIIGVFFMALSSNTFAAMYLDITNKYDLPPSMKDCRVFYLRGGGFSYESLYTIQCPDSKVSTEFNTGKIQTFVNSQKSPPKTIDLNGEKYMKIE